MKVALLIIPFNAHYPSFSIHREHTRQECIIKTEDARQDCKPVKETKVATDNQYHL